MYGENRRGGFRPRGGGSMGMTPPVKVGEELDVTIEAVGEKGDGIAKKNGFVLFIPGVKEGQQAHIRVTKVLRKVGFAEVCTPGAAPAEAAAPAESESFGEEAPAEAPAEEAPAEKSEDSESFGEESTEESEESTDEQ